MNLNQGKPRHAVNVSPLFPSPLFTTIVGQDLDAEFKSMKDESRFPFRPPVEHGDSVMSVENHILRQFPELNALLLEIFYQVKNETLKYETTQVAITTSWLTRTCKGEQSHYHIHKNSFFSGVLYFDTIPGGARLEFANFNVCPKLIDADQPTERNIYNSSVMTVNVGKNLLVFFPSYLYHRVTAHLADQPRYSLAFNMMPTGLVSTTADSQYDFGQ